MNATETANRLTGMLAVWYLRQLCDLLEVLEDRGVLPADPATTWLVRGARKFAREMLRPVAHRDVLRVLAECENQIAIEYDNECCDDCSDPGAFDLDALLAAAEKN